LIGENLFSTILLRALQSLCEFLLNGGNLVEKLTQNNLKKFIFKQPIENVQITQRNQSTTKEIVRKQKQENRQKL
jgi:hypothetical protein